MSQSQAKKDTQTKNHDSKNNYFEIFDRTSNIGMVTLDADLVVLETSRAVPKLLQLKQPLKGRRFPQFVLSRQAPIFKDSALNDGGEVFLKKVLKTGKSQQFYFEIGKELIHQWLMVEASKLEPGKFGDARIQLTIVNVTKLKQQEVLMQKQISEITSQNRQWQAIYSSMLESIVLLDTNGRVMSMNPATEKITGIKTSEGIGKHIGDIFPKVDATVPGLDAQGRSGLHQTLEEQKPSDLFEAVVATRDGRHIWVNYTYTPLKDSQGNITALVRVTSDVSTVKAVEQMKNDFVSIASHELRTPLGVISSYLMLFLHGQLGELTEDQKVYIQRVYDASDDMSALVEDLLNMSRIESGRLDLAVQPFYIRDLIDRVLSRLDQKINNKHIKIKKRFQQSRFKVWADSQKVEQALTNIIDNAIKYTYDGGTITITLKRENGSAVILVKDSGVGVNPENLGHIFEKFYRESNPLSVKEGGSGLGLYISRKLIELHGGTISVTSKLGSGSTFKLQLPVSSQKHE